MAEFCDWDAETRKLDERQYSLQRRQGTDPWRTVVMEVRTGITTVSIEVGQWTSATDTAAHIASEHQLTDRMQERLRETISEVQRTYFVTG